MRVFGGGAAVVAGVADQAVASLALLGLHLLLARLLPPAAFGAFALMVSAAMAGLAVVTAVVLDPLSVRRRAAPVYLTTALALLAALSLGLGLLAVPLMGFGGRMATALGTGLAVAPGLGLLWLARRWAYLGRRAGRALALSGAWAFSGGLGVAVLWWTGTISATGAALVSGGAAAGVGLIGVATGGGSPAQRRRRRWRRPGRALGHHGRFGGWLLAGLPFALAAQHAPLWTLAAVAGPEAAGAFRLLHLLAMPLVQLAGAVGTVLQPRWAAAQRRRNGTAERLRPWGLGFLLAAPAVPWALLLWLWPGVVGLLFGTAHGGLAALAPAMVAVGAVKALTTGPNLQLRAGHRGRAVFAGTVAAGVAALAGAVVLTPAFGLVGAIAAFLGGALANLLVLAGVLHRPVPAGPPAVEPAR